MGAFSMSRKLAGPVEQYIQLRSMHASKSTDGDDDAKGKSSTKSKPVARILADTGRVYFPGQEATARVEIDEEACAEGGPVQEIVADFNGEVHSFGYTYDANGARSTHTHTLTMFEYSAVLFSRSTPSTDPDPHSLLSMRPVSGLTPGVRAWDLQSRLPMSYGTGKGQTGLALPPTFKDTTQSTWNGTAYVFYGWKVTAKRQGAFKRHSRVWLPLLVSSLAQHPLPGPEAFRMPSASDLATAGVAPERWTSLAFSQKLRKKLIITHGEVEAELLLPVLPELPPDSTVPVALRLTVRAKSESALSGSSGRLPILPGQEGIDDQGGPRLFVRRFTNMRLGGWDALVEKDFSCNFPLRISWGRAHLETPTAGSSAQASKEPGQGHPWTPPTKTSGHFPYSTTAFLCGEMHLDLTPAFSTHFLSVSYAYRLNVPLPGIRTRIREDLPIRLLPSSGVDQALLAAQPPPTPEALTRIVAGRRIALIQQLGAKGHDDDSQDFDALLPEYDGGDWDDDEDEGEKKQAKGSPKSNKSQKAGEDPDALPGYHEDGANIGAQAAARGSEKK